MWMTMFVGNGEIQSVWYIIGQRIYKEIFEYSQFDRSKFMRI